MTEPFSVADRRALFAVATQFFSNGVVFASFVPRLPEIRDRLDISLGVLGAIAATAGLFGIVGSALCRPLIERFTTRGVVIVAGVGLIAMLPAVGFAQSPVALLLALSGLAAFDVLVDVAMNMQGSWLSNRRHTPVMNRLHGLWSLGTVVGGLIVAQVASAGVSLETHLTAAAVLMGLVLVGVARNLLKVDEHPSGSAYVTARPASSRRTGPLALFALAGGFALAVEITQSDWAAFRLTDDFGTAAGFAGLGFVAHTVGMTTARFGGDWLQTRVGSDRLLRLSLAVAAMGLVMSTVIPNRYVVLVGLVVAGLGIAPLFPKLYDDAAKHPGRPGAGLGAMTAGTRVAGLAVPAIVGTLAATDLSVGSAMLLVTLPSVLGIWAVSAVRSPAVPSRV